MTSTTRQGYEKHHCLFSFDLLGFESRHVGLPVRLVCHHSGIEKKGPTKRQYMSACSPCINYPDSKFFKRLMKWFSACLFSGWKNRCNFKWRQNPSKVLSAAGNVFFFFFVSHEMKGKQWGFNPDSARHQELTRPSLQSSCHQRD